jgi:hypothetical protein
MASQARALWLIIALMTSTVGIPVALAWVTPSRLTGDFIGAVMPSIVLCGLGGLAVGYLVSRRLEVVTTLTIDPAAGRYVVRRERLDGGSTSDEGPLDEIAGFTASLVGRHHRPELRLKRLPARDLVLGTRAALPELRARQDVLQALQLLAGEMQQCLAAARGERPGPGEGRPTS